MEYQVRVDEMCFMVEAFIHVRATPEVMEAVNLLNKNRVHYVDTEHTSDWSQKVYYWREKDLPVTLKTITTPKDALYDRVPIYDDILEAQIAIKSLEKDS